VAEIKILVHLYSHDAMKIKWIDSVLATFELSTEVRKERIVASVLNLYIIDLFKQLKARPTGCMGSIILLNLVRHVNALFVSTKHLSPAAPCCLLSVRSEI